MNPPASHRVKSFPPQVGEDCRVLVLGTVPSLRSLELRQSYGHAQNLFWTFMGELFDAGRELPYAERIARLHARGIGIWDVYAQVERPGSLDSSIVKASEVPNAIPQLLARETTIRAIALNGGKAAEGFRRHIEPRLDATLRARLDVLALPSTSPANASISRAGKFERWSVLRQYAKPAAASRKASPTTKLASLNATRPTFRGETTIGEFHASEDHGHDDAGAGNRTRSQ